MSKSTQDTFTVVRDLYVKKGGAWRLQMRDAEIALCARHMRKHSREIDDEIVTDEEAARRLEEVKEAHAAAEGGDEAAKKRYAEKLAVHLRTAQKLKGTRAPCAYCNPRAELWWGDPPEGFQP